MFRSYTKRVSTVNFTIHEMRLPEPYSDKFYIQWKRGNFTGMTEQCISNDENSVFFDKKFTCKVTLYISKKDGSIKPKIILFKVYRLINLKDKKIFGELEMDVSTGYQKAPITQTYSLKSPHHKTSQLIISYEVIPDPIRDEDELDTDIASASEAMVQSDDKLEHWDISEALSPEDADRVRSFFMDRENQKQSFLKEFGQLPTPRKHTRSRAQGVPMPDKSGKRNTVQLTGYDLFESNPEHRSSSPQPQNTSNVSKKHKKETVPTRMTPGSESSNNRRLPPRIPVLDPTQRRSSEDPQRISFIPLPKDSQTEPKALIRSLLSKQWCKSPIFGDSVPQPSVAIYTAFLTTDILSISSTINESTFKEFVEDFFVKYKRSDIVGNAKPIDRFIVSIYLLFLFENMQNANPIRTEQLITHLKQHCTDLLKLIINPLLGDFQKIIQDLVSSLLDQLSLINDLSSLINAAQMNFSDTNSIKDFFTQNLISAIDFRILQYITDTPTSCTFTAAIQWNSTNTVLSEKDFNFPMFREAASALMMSTILCSDPKSSDEICPHLKKEFVLKILMNQQPDDFCPIPNDVTTFIHEYNISSTSTAGKDVFEYSTNFDELKTKLNVEDWKSTKFDSLTLTAFPYLKKFFT